ncbi:conserved hypothetical protein [Ricinus communis]|uniref:Uncharacterized protein n=1 Tax=Ricinus communis TaxID=3988 RepID=B9SUB9_RICCO|nr:conserved hypothetical protein [Ricinus communis]
MITSGGKQQVCVYHASLWFVKANYITKRFVFDAKAIAALRAKAKGKLKAEPTQIATLSCFIWKCSMAASRAISGAQKPPNLVEAVKIRCICFSKSNDF